MGGVQHHQNLRAVLEVARLRTELRETMGGEGRDTRSCRCVICSATPNTASLSSYMEQVSSHLPPEMTMQVVHSPPGRDFFFVSRDDEGSERHHNAFIHMNTYTNIVGAIRSKFSCTDMTPITRPSPGDVVIGVLGRDLTLQLRVDGGATRLAHRQ